MPPTEPSAVRHGMICQRIHSNRAVCTIVPVLFHLLRLARQTSAVRLFPALRNLGIDFVMRLPDDRLPDRPSGPRAQRRLTAM